MEVQERVAIATTSHVLTVVQQPRYASISSSVVGYTPITPTPIVLYQHDATQTVVLSANLAKPHEDLTLTHDYTAYLTGDTILSPQRFNNEERFEFPLLRVNCVTGLFRLQFNLLQVENCNMILLQTIYSEPFEVCSETMHPRRRKHIPLLLSPTLAENIDSELIAPPTPPEGDQPNVDLALQPSTHHPLSSIPISNQNSPNIVSSAQVVNIHGSTVTSCQSQTNVNQYFFGECTRRSNTCDGSRNVLVQEDSPPDHGVLSNTRKEMKEVMDTAKNEWKREVRKELKEVIIKTVKDELKQVTEERRKDCDVVLAEVGQRHHEWLDLELGQQHHRDSLLVRQDVEPEHSGCVHPDRQNWSAQADIEGRIDLKVCSDPGNPGTSDISRGYRIGENTTKRKSLQLAGDSEHSRTACQVRHEQTSVNWSCVDYIAHKLLDAIGLILSRCGRSAECSEEGVRKSGRFEPGGVQGSREN